MKLSYQLQAEHLTIAAAVAQAQCQEVTRRSMPTRIAFWLFATAFAISLLASFGIYQSYSGQFTYDFSYVFFPMLVAFGSLPIYLKIHARTHLQAVLIRYAPYPVDETLTLSDRGIEIENRFGLGVARWIAIRQVVEQKNHVVIVVNSMMAFVVPETAFSDLNEKAEFLTQIRSRLALQQGISHTR